MNKMNIAITGVSGYIGSYLFNYFQSQNYNVYEMGRKKKFADERHFIPFHLGGENCYDALDNIDILIHCAYDFSLTDAKQIKKINTEGSIALLDAAKQHNVKKIIYFSTTSAFAGAKSDYGKAKYEVEQFAQRLHGLNIVRPGLVFNKNPGGIVGALNKLVCKLPILPIIGKGGQCFYPCHLEDLARLLMALVQQNFNISTPIIAAAEQWVTFKQIMLTLAQWHQRKVLLIPVPYSWVFSGLKLAECLRLKLGLRSDSLKYMKYYEKTPDFSATRLIGVDFRGFSVETLSE